MPFNLTEAERKIEKEALRLLGVEQDSFPEWFAQVGSQREQELDPVDSEDIDRLLDLCVNHPWLTKRKFSFKWGKIRYKSTVPDDIDDDDSVASFLSFRYPTIKSQRESSVCGILAVMLRTGSSVVDIMKVCERFYPEKPLSSTDDANSDRANPLSFACEFAKFVAEGTIPYLIGKYPSQACDSDLVECLIEKSGSRSVLNLVAFYNVNPSAFTPLIDTAIVNQEPEGVDFLMSRVDPSDYQSIDLWDVENGLEVLAKLERIPFAFKALSIDCRFQWCEEAWHALMRLVPPKGIEKLTVCDSEDLNELFVSALGTRHLRNLLSTYDGLKELKIGFSWKENLDEEEYKELESKLPFDLTTSILTVLNSSVQFFDAGGVGQSHFAFDFRSVTSALKGNTVMKELELPNDKKNYSRSRMLDMLEHNTALLWTNLHTDWCWQRAWPEEKRKWKEHAREVQYLLWLNKFGRKTVRDVHSTKAEFVGLLVRVQNCETTEIDESNLNDVKYYNTMVKKDAPFQAKDQLGVIYGLLRECPDKWSDITAVVTKKGNRKRKYENTKGEM